VPFRDFTAEAAERARERDPIEFTLGGVRLRGRDILPFGAVLDLADAPNEKDDVAGAMRAFIRFFEEVVVDDQTHLVEDAVRGSDFYERHDIIPWLSGEYAGRPTHPSSGSAVSPLPDGRASSSEPSDTASAA
jgi:hypothetical protein